MNDDQMSIHLSNSDQEFYSAINSHKYKTNTLLNEIQDSKKIYTELKCEKDQVAKKLVAVGDSSLSIKKDSKLLKEKISDCTNRLETAQKQNKTYGESIKEWSNKIMKENLNIVTWVLDWGKQVTQLTNEVEKSSQQYDKFAITNKLNHLNKEQDTVKSKLHTLKLQKKGDKKKKFDLLNRIREGGCSQFLKSSEAKQAISVSRDVTKTLQKNLYREKDLAREIKELQEWIAKNQTKI